MKSSFYVKEYFAFRVGALGIYESDAYRTIPNSRHRFAIRFPSKLHIHRRSFLLVTYMTSILGGTHILGIQACPNVLHHYLCHVRCSCVTWSSALFYRRILRVFHNVFGV